MSRRYASTFDMSNAQRLSRHNAAEARGVRAPSEVSDGQLLLRLSPKVLTPSTTRRATHGNQEEEQGT